MKTCPYCGAQLQDAETFCRNCGNVIGAAQDQPQPMGYPKRQTVYVPSGQMPPAKEKMSKSAKTALCLFLALLILVLSVSVGVAVYIKKFGQNAEETQSDYENMMRKFKEEEMVAFYFNDYNADGKNEAFAIVGDGNKETGEYEDANLWFVNEDSTKVVTEHMTGHTNGLIESGDTKFISLENERAGGTSSSDEPETASYIYGVKGSHSYEPSISGKYQNVRQDGGDIVADSPDSDRAVFLVLQDNGEFRVNITDLPDKSTVSSAAQSTTAKTSASRQTTRQGKTARQAYQEVLRDIHSNPLNYYQSMSGTGDNVESNEFAFADINNDGVEELLVRISDGPMSEMKTLIWGYDASAQQAYKFKSSLGYGSDFYSTGYCKVEGSHNHTYGDLWPFGISEVGHNDVEYIGGFESKDKDLCESMGVEFPEAEDKDHDGVIYYKTLSNGSATAMTKTEFDQECNRYVPENKKLNIQYMELTTANINAVA